MIKVIHNGWTRALRNRCVGGCVRAMGVKGVCVRPYVFVVCVQARAAD